MMSEVKSIILIYLIKTDFSYFFSTSVSEVVQTKNTMKGGSKSSRTGLKVTWRFVFPCAFLRGKKIKLPESVWEKTLKWIWNM